MNAQEIAQLVSLCRTRAGLKVEPEKSYLIENRLAPVARRLSFESISDLLAAIHAKREEPLIWAVVEAMTGSETSFFRDRTPFDDFAREIVPQIARSRPGGPIRVWSAACSTGQEIYSLAMLAAELCAQAPSLRIDLAASDLSRMSLERAQAGLYNQFEVQRGLPIRLLAQHFDKEGEQWRISSEIRQRVRWRRINLIAGLKQLGRFDVVFCRNVLGQMTPEAQRTITEDLVSIVPPDGYLVLGLKEQIPAVAEVFQPIVGRPGIYRPVAQTRAAVA